jgi:hypothetical protein
VTVEFLDSANKPLVIPQAVRANAAALVLSVKPLAKQQPSKAEQQRSSSEGERSRKRSFKQRPRIERQCNIGQGSES